MIDYTIGVKLVRRGAHSDSLIIFYLDISAASRYSVVFVILFANQGALLIDHRQIRNCLFWLFWKLIGK